MKKFLAVLLIITYTGWTTGAYATECQKPVVTLNEGDPAPCRGFLFSPAKEKEIRLLDQEYQILLDKSVITEKQLELYKANTILLESVLEKEQKKAQLWQDHAEKYTEKYIKEQENRSNRDWLFFAGGVLLTIGAAWAVGQASK